MTSTPCFCFSTVTMSPHLHWPLHLHPQKSIGTLSRARNLSSHVLNYSGHAMTVACGLLAQAQPLAHWGCHCSESGVRGRVEGVVASISASNVGDASLCYLSHVLFTLFVQWMLD